jgi:hypothetical protein
MFKVTNEYYTQDGELGSSEERGNNTFLILFESFNLRVVASDGMGVCVGVATKPYPKLARDVLYEKSFLG